MITEQVSFFFQRDTYMGKCAIFIDGGYLTKVLETTSTASFGLPEAELRSGWFARKTANVLLRLHALPGQPAHPGGETETQCQIQIHPTPSPEVCSAFSFAKVD